MKTNLDVDSLTNNYVEKRPNIKQKIDSGALYKPGVKGSTNNDSISITFRVQFLSAPKAQDLTSKYFAALDDVYEYKQGDIFKYTAGKFGSIKEAVVYQSKMQSLGFADCFVVAFNKNERIPPSEATKILNRQNNSGDKSVN